MKNYKHNKGKIKKKSNLSVNFSKVIVIIILSVAAGYLSTKYFIYPVILGLSSDDFEMNISILNNEEDSQNEKSNNGEEKDVIEDNLDIKNLPDTDNASLNEQDKAVSNDYEDGFCLQYGSFSSVEGAEKLVSQLKKDGIEANIIAKDGAYKVIGNLFSTKEAAESEKILNADKWKDVFIIRFP